MPANTMRRLARGVAAASLLWALVLGLDWAPALRGDYGWRWPYAFPPPYPGRLIWLALVLGLYLAGAWWLRRRRSPVGLIVWAIAGCAALTIAVLLISTSDPRYELYVRTLSNLTTGWHQSAVDMENEGGVVAGLRNWPDFMQRYGPSHLSVSAPGLTLVYYAANRTLELFPALAQTLSGPLRAQQCDNLLVMADTNAQLAGTWFGILMPLWAGLAVAPLYWIGRRFFNWQVASWAVIAWPLIPSLLLFSPYPGTAFPVLSLLVIGLLLEGLERRSAIWALASGLMMSIFSFLAFSVIPLVVLAGTLILLTYWINKDEWHLSGWWLLKIGLLFGLGAASTWIAYTLITGISPWASIEVMLSQRAGLDRPYLPWLVLQLNDFGMLTGWPFVLIAVIGSWLSLRKLRSGAQWPTGASLAPALLITLVVMDVLSITRGEVGRIWLFMAPFVVLAAAELFAHDDSNHSGWIIIGAQAVMVLAVVAFVHAIDSGVKPAASGPPALSQSSDSQSLLPAGAVFDHALHLERFTGSVATLPDASGVRRPSLVVWLAWRSTGQVDHAYFVSLIPVSPAGKPAANAILLQPFGEKFPTTCWLPGSGPLMDRLVIPLEENVRGDWWVSLSLIDGRTGYRPAVSLPDGSTDVQVGIGPFREQGTP